LSQLTEDQDQPVSRDAPLACSFNGTLPLNLILRNVMCHCFVGRQITS